jgi:carbamoyl-phosphate synthase small subunit
MLDMGLSFPGLGVYGALLMPAFTPTPPKGATAALALADGSVFWGRGFGAACTAVGEVCFTTGMTGYQETLTDPSFAGQIVTFTFPHIGNVGTNDEDLEAAAPFARAAVLREAITAPSNWRAAQGLHQWLEARGVPGICGVDTRALTIRIRDAGAPGGALIHAPDGRIDPAALVARARAFGGLAGLDLAAEVTCAQPYAWTEPRWGERTTEARHHVVAVDFGAKRNILRCLASAGCRVTVVPAQTTAQEVLALKPDGVFLSNGPGDPAATGAYAAPMITGVMAAGVPLFGICLGHQLLALALGARTRKMHLGHRGANQPVKDLATGKVEITSQNHGFEVVRGSLPPGVRETHVSLFDGSNEGLACDGAFSVQYHPEASPGPHDSHYLFARFVNMMARRRA